MTATQLLVPHNTSSIQPPPSVKLDTAQEKYSYAYRSLCEMSKTVANVLSNCGKKELMEKLSSCEAFFRNLTTFPTNQTRVDLKAAPAQLAQTTATSSLGPPYSTKLLVPLVKARSGRPKNVKAVKWKFFPNQVKKAGLATVKADMLNIYKRYSLSDADLNVLVQGTSISDSVINVAQYLIQKIYPTRVGFQDVLLGQRLQFAQVKGPFIQILHVRNPNHCLTVTNIGADKNTIFVYDTIDQDTPLDAVRHICHMLKSQSPTLTILTTKAQNQCNTLDCGLFAIANMYYIASGRKPENLNLNQVICCNAYRKVPSKTFPS